jgi:hypothetical protein
MFTIEYMYATKQISRKYVVVIFQITSENQGVSTVAKLTLEQYIFWLLHFFKRMHLPAVIGPRSDVVSLTTILFPRYEGDMMFTLGCFHVNKDKELQCK